MKRTAILRAALLAVPVRAAEKPNLIGVVADNLGYECVVANGGQSYKTPHLDRFAQAGSSTDTSSRSARRPASRGDGETAPCPESPQRTLNRSARTGVRIRAPAAAACVACQRTAPHNRKALDRRGP
jgi:hypothetical protein